MSDLIEVYAAWLRAAGKSPITIRVRCQVLRRLNEELDFGLDGALSVELVTWLDRDDWSVQTKANYRDHIVGYLRWAVAQGHLDYDASTNLPRPRVPRGLPRPATETALRAALTLLPEPWNLYVRLAAFAGLRAAEIAALWREHVTAAEILVHGKGRKMRLVPTDASIWACVQRLPPGPVARLLRSGRQASADYVSRQTGRHLDRVGLDDLTLHWFRHRFGTQTMKFCKNIRVVQELMGHTSPATTAIYTQVTADELREAVAGLPAVD